MDFQVLIDLAIKVVIMVGTGFVARKVGIFTPELEKGVSNLLLTIIMPIGIIAASACDYSQEMVQNMLLMAAIALIYYVVSLLFMRQVKKFLPFKEREKTIFLTMAVFANTAFIGYPICQELYGAEGYVYCVIYNFFYQCFFYTYGISTISGETKVDLKSIFLKPVNAALVIMIVLFVAQIKLPSAVISACSSINSMMVPLSMMIIGASLVGMKPSQIIMDKKSYLVSLFRLILFPLITFIVMKLMGFSGMMLVISVIMAGLPSGSLNVIFAKQYDCEADFAAGCVVQTMLFCLVTVPVLIVLCTML